jgi:hypothetical protein
MTAISDEELWAELVEEAGEDLIEAAASVSVEQAEADLRAAGFDLDEEQARAEAFLASLAGTQAEAKERPAETKKETPGEEKVVPPKPAARTTRRPLVVWAVAAAAVAASTATLYLELRPPMVASPSPEALAAAAELRHRATVACDEGRPAECLSLLDGARAKDPAGDAEPEVARLRARAERDLGAGRK